MAVQWTEKQRVAIETRDKTLLVSAAAGSGKTATLTQRIIESITDEKNPADISRMLIVTFTRAAASELRERISKSVAEAEKNNPESKHLARQALLIPDAHICTIDSFCKDILSSHSQEIGISSYRICDETEDNLISHMVMERIVNGCFDGVLPEVCDEKEFAWFSENMTRATDEAELSGKLNYIYQKTEGFCDRIGFFRKIRDGFDFRYEFFNSPWGAEIRRFSETCLGHYTVALTKIYTGIKERGDIAEKKYGPALRYDIEYVNRCLKALKQGYEYAREAILQQDFVKISTVREKEPDEYSVYAKTIHKNVKDSAEKLSGLFLYTREDLYALSNQGKRFYDILISVLSEYEKRLNEEKRRRGIFSFSDVEYYTYKLLCNEDGSKTEIAENISKNYDYVYIDEYQDVNLIQHRIFECVSRKDNRFMVGDIKQSIYSFRGAKPEIFADLRRKYPKIEGADGKTATVFMSENFRCDRGVIDFVNGVFDLLFEAAKESINYEKADRLLFSKKQGGSEMDNEILLPQVHLFSSENSEEYSAANEAEYVAEEIKRLIETERLDNGDPIKPSDIAIIMRGTKGKAGKYLLALERIGINAETESKENFFDSPDVLMMLAILNTIDNPRRDTYLAGCMHSPVFGFSMEELVKIRKEGGDAPSLYDALLLYAQNHPEHARISSFISTTEDLRNFAKGVSVDKLISAIYSKTDVLAVCESRTNLRLFYNYARTFEASSFKGLYNFINYVNEIIREKRTVSVSATTAGGGVKIITAHHSKGLEFPICIVCNCGAPYSTAEYNENLVFDADLGVFLRFLDESGFAVIDNPMREAVCLSSKRKRAEEELRILYVALTRARERLYVTATSSRSQAEKMIDAAEVSAPFADEFTVISASNYSSLILQGLVRSAECAKIILHNEERLKNDENGQKSLIRDGMEKVKEKNKEDTEKKIRDLSAAIEENLSFEYKYGVLSSLPAKISVSKLYPRVLDGTDDDNADEEISFDVKGKLPSFMSGELENEGAEKGNATHLFLQFCDFNNVTEKGIESELKRLTDKKFISDKDATLIRKEELKRFFNSKLFSDMREAKRMWKELRFNAKLPASDFTTDAKRIEALAGTELLVQGVIDCVYEDKNGNIVLVDYKTDRVPKDRKEARKILVDRHSSQLLNYAKVCVKMFGRYPEKVLIYSLAMSESISVI